MMTKNKAQTAQPSHFGRTFMEILALSFAFAGLLFQFAQNEYAGGYFIICIAVLLYSLPRIYDKSELRFSAKDKGKWQNASLEDYQNLIKHVDGTAKTHRMLSPKTSLIIFYCASIVVLLVGYGVMPDYEAVFYGIINLLALLHIYLQYKLPAPRPALILQKLPAFECITAFDYPKDFKLQIQFRMKKLYDNVHEAPYDIRFSIDYRHKSPEWFSLNITVLPNPKPFFCYAVFVATVPSPVFYAFEAMMLPPAWKNEAKLNKTYPSLAMTFPEATNSQQINKLLSALTTGISSDGFHAVLNSKVKNVDEAFKLIENPESDEDYDDANYDA